MPAQYKVIVCDTVSQLEMLVTRHVNNGWQLQGGICVTVAVLPKYPDRGAVTVASYSQAVVK